MLALFAALLLAPRAAAADSDIRRAYWSSLNGNQQSQQSYSLPPAIYYQYQNQWREYKRKHDEQLEKDYAETARMNAAVRAPSSVYAAPAPKPADNRPKGPSYSEVREFKDTFAEVVTAFISDKAHSSEGAFLLKDDQTGEVLRLKLAHIRTDGLRYHSATVVSGCADFTTAEQPKRSVDLDFELTKDWEWGVSHIFLHAVNGRPRFAYDVAGRRVGIGAPERTAAIPSPTAPANLNVDIRPADPDDPALDGGGGLSVTVSNAGPGTAYAVRLHIDVRAAPAGVTLPSDVDFGDLPKDAAATKVLPVAVAEGAPEGTVKALAVVNEANGFDSEPVLLEFGTSAPRRAVLELAAASLEGGTLKPGQTTRLTATLRNSGQARAAGASATLRVNGPDLFMSGEPTVALGDLAPGESKDAVFEFFVNRRAAPGADLPVSLSAADARGLHGFTDRALPVKMGQPLGPVRELALAGRAPAAEALDVDRPPSARTRADPQAYAIVVGIEKYRDVADAEFAAHDAQTVYDYLTESMGFQRENVALLQNERAGRADLSTYFGPWLADHAAGGKARVFIYYSGHGTVDAKTGETYLVPYDGDPAYPETKGYALKDLYASLGRLGVEAVVTLDSCFSGSGGRSILQAGIRPLVSVKSAPVPGNVVVLSASGGEQISASLPSARHGLMTYYLLRGLNGEADADHDGRVTTLELYRYLSPAVESEARLQHVEQRPRLEPSPEAIGARGGRVWLVRRRD